MPKQIIIAEQHRIAAVFSEDQIQEIVVATGSHQVSDIYLGVVENVLPGIDAAFVNIGDAERNGFIHVSDLGPLRLKRSAGAITELLAPQQKVLVQVMKEPTGNKGPRLTGNITLPGRYLVLMPFGRGVHLSRRIRNETERNRLRALAILVKPSGMGLLVRTEAEGMSEDAVIEDLEFLQKQWESIQEEASSNRPPCLLNRDDDFIQRVLREMYNTDVNRIVVDSNPGLKRVKQQLLNWSGGKSPQGVLIDHHQDPVGILEYFRVNAAIREALKPRVDLPSGGYIIIEPTEALTVIDVNSGSFTRSATSRETVLWTNCEAATEIARQLRLRNIAGVIIVDFIDMDSRRDQLQVLEHFNKSIKADKARPQIAQLSELGLVELTRKRQGQNIYELFGRPCPTCSGLGHLVHLPGEPEHKLEGTRGSEPRTPAPEPRPAKATLPETVSESVGETESDNSDDLQELDLIHHPSYQELGGGNGNRRRRRRRIETGESSAPTKTSSPSSSSSSRSSDRDDMPIKSRSRLRRDPHLDYAESETSDDDRSSKGDRAKSSRSDSSGDRDTASVVSVEMTPEEQEIYALMGISPLVRLNRTIDNPKSTIVSVKSPGETQEDADSGNGQSQVDASPEPSASEAESEPETSESNDTPPITRRRRRRSSASDSNES